MCVGGGGSAPEAEESSQEKIAAREAVDKHNERHEDGYDTLEQQAIADSSRDHTQLLRGMGGAELAKSEAGAYTAANMNRKGIGFGDVANATSASSNNVEAQARQQALTIKDAKTMGVIRTGQDMSNNASGAVMNSAHNSLNVALGNLQAESARQQARYENFAKVARTGMAIAGDYYGNKPDTAVNYNVTDPGSLENGVAAARSNRPLTYDEYRGSRIDPYGGGFRGA